MGVTTMGVGSTGLLSLLACYWLLLLCVRSGVFYYRDFGLTLLREPKFPPYTLRTVYRLSLMLVIVSVMKYHKFNYI